MATENITISKASLLKAYRGAEPSQQEFLKQLFGPNEFAISFNVMDRVKSFRDAVDELGNNHPLVWEYNQICSEFGNLMGKDIIAYLKLRIITAALNEGWEPQYTEEERRYYPYLGLITKEQYDSLPDYEKKRCVVRSRHNADDGLVLAHTRIGVACSHAGDGVRLAFKTRELAEYAGKQFINIWADFVFKSKDNE